MDSDDAAHSESDSDQIIVSAFVRAVGPHLQEVLAAVERDLVGGGMVVRHDAMAFLRATIERAFDAGLDSAALRDAAYQLPDSADALSWARTANTYLHVLLRYLRGHVFKSYGSAPQVCCRVIDALHSRLFNFGSAMLQSLGARRINQPETSASAYDVTTGLPGAQLMAEAVAELLEDSYSSGNTLAVLALWIDFFESSEEPLAFAQNESLFAEAARRLRHALRPDDIIGRLGRDEFILCLPGLPGAGVALLAAGKFLRVLDEKFWSEGHEVVCRASIGVAMYPEHAADADNIIRYAQIAGEASRASPDRFALYDRNVHRETQMKVSLEAQLRSALQENALMTYLQPQADLRSGRIVGAESLLRWKLKDGTWVPPQQIVSVAEDAGLQTQLTMAVVNGSLRNLAAMMRTDPGIDIKISVNVSPKNLTDRELPDFIAQALQTWGIPPRQMVIEVTESAMIGDIEQTIETLHRLKEIGVNLSLDDFGTGYSSLAYLKRMPLDELKIDQIFVRSMLTSKPDERIVRSVIDLARHFDLKVIAEGAEDEATLHALAALGVDAVQGYFIAKPMPSTEFGWWYRACGGKLRLSIDEIRSAVESGIWQSRLP